MRQYILKNDGNCDYKFVGKILVSVNNGDGEILTVFITEGGRLVGRKIIDRKSHVMHLRTRKKTRPYEYSYTNDHIFDFFGWSDLAKKLYDKWELPGRYREIN